MAQSTEEVPNLTGMVTDPDLFPSKLPEGVQKTSEWYAHRRTYRDGRQVWEFFKRKSGGGPVGADGKPGDAVAATIETEVPAIKEKWDKEQAEAAKPPATVSAPPTQPNIVTRNPDGSLATQPNPNYTPPSGSTAKDWRTEGTPLPGGGFDNSKPIMAAYVNGQRTGETRQPTAGELKDWNEAGQMTRNPGGKTDAQIDTERRQQDADARAAADRNKPSVTIKEDASGQLVAISVYPDGRPSTTESLGVRGTPQQVKGPDGTTYERGPDGTYKPAAGIPTAGAGLKNVDPFVPDYTKPDLGIGAWSTAQRQKIGKPANQGGITQKEYEEAATAAHQQATVTIQNVTAATSVQRQQVQDQRAEAARRVDQSQADATAGEKAESDLWKYTTPGSAAIMGVAPFTMMQRRGAAGLYGDRQVADPQLHPMFQGMLAQGQAVSAAPPAAPTQPSAVAPVPPSAAELEAQRQQVMAANQAAVAPLLSPPPTAATAPVTAPTAAPGPAVPRIRFRNARTGEIREMAPMELDALPDVADWMALDPNAAAGVFTPQQGNPQPSAAPPPIPMPVNIPYPTSPGLESSAPPQDAGMFGWVNNAVPMGAQPPAPQPTPPTNEGPMLPGMQALMRPQFDPMPTVARLRAMGMSSEAIALALKEEGLL